MLRCETAILVAVRIDLHTHSAVSDGTDSPAELVRLAAEAGLDVIALTDHDTTEGWAAAVAALPDGLALVRGMEMSCSGRAEDGGAEVEVHLLAYLFDPHNRAMEAELERLRDERDGRLRKMAELMAADGLPIDPDAVMDSVGASAGRPHLARALVDAGIVPTVGDAFHKLLSRDSPYYVGKGNTELGAAVDLVKAAGGVSVIAHARAHKRGRLLAVDHIEELVERGLGGLEIDHPDHDAAGRALLTGIAASHDLIVTGSSDYHGANKHVRLGDYQTRPESLEAIAERATGVEIVGGKWA